MSMQKVKIINPNNSWRGTECYIDGNKISGVTSADFRVAVDEAPSFTFETFGLPDIDMSGNVEFSFTPQTVQQAAIVLRNELLKRSELYDSFLASMRSAIDDDFWNKREKCGYEVDIGKDDFNEAAELMLCRIIGLEGTDMARNCGNCDYCQKDGLDMICTNEDSEYLADYVEEQHCCDDWDSSDCEGE